MLPSLVAGMLVASVSRLKMSDTTRFANDAVTAPIEAAAAAPEAIASERHPPQWLARSRGHSLRFPRCSL